MVASTISSVDNIVSLLRAGARGAEHTRSLDTIARVFNETPDLSARLAEHLDKGFEHNMSPQELKAHAVDFLNNTAGLSADGPMFNLLVRDSIIAREIEHAADGARQSDTALSEGDITGIYRKNGADITQNEIQDSITRTHRIFSERPPRSHIEPTSPQEVSDDLAAIAGENMTSNFESALIEATRPGRSFSKEQFDALLQRHNIDPESIEGIRAEQMFARFERTELKRHSKYIEDMNNLTVRFGILRRMFRNLKKRASIAQETGDNGSYIRYRVAMETLRIGSWLPLIALPTAYIAWRNDPENFNERLQDVGEQILALSSQSVDFLAYISPSLKEFLEENMPHAIEEIANFLDFGPSSIENALLGMEVDPEVARASSLLVAGSPLLWGTEVLTGEDLSAQRIANEINAGLEHTGGLEGYYREKFGGDTPEDYAAYIAQNNDNISEQQALVIVTEMQAAQNITLDELLALLEETGIEQTHTGQATPHNLSSSNSSANSNTPTETSIPFSEAAGMVTTGMAGNAVIDQGTDLIDDISFLFNPMEWKVTQVIIDFFDILKKIFSNLLKSIFDDAADLANSVNILPDLANLLDDNNILAQPGMSAAQPITVGFGPQGEQEPGHVGTNNSNSEQPYDPEIA